MLLRRGLVPPHGALSRALPRALIPRGLSSAPPPPRRPPTPPRPVPPPRRGPGGSGGGGGEVATVAPKPAGGGGVVAQATLGTGSRSMKWNLLWLFGGLTLAGSLFATVPQEMLKQQQVLQRRSEAAPRLTAAQVASFSPGLTADHAILKARNFIRDLQVTPSQLRNAVLSVAPLNVAGTGLREVLGELLSEGLERDEASGGADLSSSECSRYPAPPPCLRFCARG